MDEKEHTEVYTVTLTLTGDDARKLADRRYEGSCYSQRKNAILGALRDHGAVLSFTRTERHVAVYDLTHPDFENSGADV